MAKGKAAERKARQGDARRPPPRSSAPRSEGRTPDPARWWLLFAYKVPRHPSANRVHVWRKLKRLGAVLLNDALWVLPPTAQNREQFQWLAAEIEELGGEHWLWESRLVLDAMEKPLIAEFESQVQAPYEEILAALKRPAPDLAALSRRYQRIKAQDYFQCELGRRVLQALMAARNGGSKR